MENYKYDPDYEIPYFFDTEVVDMVLDDYSIQLSEEEKKDYILKALTSKENEIYKQITEQVRVFILEDFKDEISE